ncbi:MAG: hypothetical protein U0Y08_06845 [Bacteroidia bacterium]
MKWHTVILSSLLISGDVRAGPPKEYILNTAPLSEWAVFKIRRQLACLEGLHFSGYDARSSCLLMQFDPDKIAGGFLILDMVRGLNKPMKFREVKGYTIYDIIDGKYKPVTSHAQKR